MSNFKLRIVAANKKLKFFYGSPCRVCGGSLRYTSTSGCVVCAAKRSAEKYAEMKSIIAKLKKET
jgi:hypothetical protein